MKFTRLVILLSNHGWEDFPVHLQGNDAAEVLACWTAPWHPLLLSECQRIPEWRRSDQPLEDAAGSLILIPGVTKRRLDDTWIAQHSEIAKLIIAPRSRAEACSQLGLVGHDGHDGQTCEKADAIDDQDFHALGFAYLQTQLLTHRLRYSSTLDAALFEQHTIAAAIAHAAGNAGEARPLLQMAFDLLLAERNRYYPVDAQLVDITLLNQKTFGRQFIMEARTGPKTNVLSSMQDLSEISAKFPEAFAEFVDTVRQGRVQPIAGSRVELPEPLLASISVIRQIAAGRDLSQSLFGVEPTVFGRFSGGLHPGLPQLLTNFQFRGCLHMGFRDFRLPPAAGATICWRGIGGDSIDAIAEHPRDANQPESFLRLAVDVGEQIDSAHHATIVFAHWPGQTCDYFRDILRVCRFNSLFGKFVLCDDLFASMYNPGYGDNFEYDDYRAGWLSTWVSEQRINPISSCVEYWSRHYQWLGLRSLTLMIACAGSDLRNESSRLDNLMGQIDELVQPASPIDAETRSSLRDHVTANLHLIEKDLLVQAAAVFCDSASENPATVLINPSFAARRHLHCGEGNSPFSPDPPVVLTVCTNGLAAAVVDIPGTGVTRFVRRSADGTAAKTGRADPSMVVENSLRNEFFEVEIDGATGGVCAIRNHGSRTNLLSQQLAVALTSVGVTDAESAQVYATMIADEVRFDASRPASASSKTRGRLEFNGALWGRFTQCVTVTRGQRTIEFEVTIDLQRELARGPWSNYICTRFAWNEDAIDRHRSIHETDNVVRLEKFTSPNYIHVTSGSDPITLLPRGLPFHRQSAARILDTLLIVAGECERTFRFGVAIGQVNPQTQAIGQLLPVFELPGYGLANRSHRFFHVAPRNITVLDAAPEFDETGRSRGAKLWLRESFGETGECTILAPRKLESANLVDLTGRSLHSLAVADDRISVDYHGYKLFCVQMNW